MGCLRLFILIWVARVLFLPASTSDRDYFNVIGPHPPDHLMAHMSELLDEEYMMIKAIFILDQVEVISICYLSIVDEDRISLGPF